MKSKLLLTLLLLTTFSGINAQETKLREFSDQTKDSSFAIPSVKEKFAPKFFSKNEKSSNQTPQTNQTQQISPYVRPTGKKRFKRYVNSVIGPVSLALNAANAGIATATNTPEEWGKNWEGFGRRFASNFGRGAIKQTTIYGLDEAFKLDSRFYRSQKKDFSSRMKNALLSTVSARKSDGKRVFGFPRIAGTYASHIIAFEAWYPNRYNYKDGFRTGTISLGVNAAVNVLREFIIK